MRAAGEHADTIHRRRANGDGRNVADAAVRDGPLEGPGFGFAVVPDFPAPIDLFEGWCGNHAEHRAAVLDQGDVDGELAVLLQEFLGSVERVDQEVPRTCRRQLAGFDRFFGHHRNVGELFRKARKNDFLGCRVGLGHRRPVDLVLDLERFRVDFEDFLSGPQGQQVQERYLVFSHRCLNSRREILPPRCPPAWLSRK